MTGVAATAMLVGSTAAACASDPDWVQATEPWVEPDAYRYTLVGGCGEHQLAGRFDIVVRSGRVVDFERTDVADARKRPYEDVIPTLGDLIAAIRAVADPAAVTASFADDGHPRSIEIVYTEGADGTVCYDIEQYMVEPGA